MQRYHPPRPRLDSAGDEVDRLSCGLVGSGNEVEAGDEGVDGAGEGKEGGEDVGYAGVGARAEDDETFTFDVYHDVPFIHNHLNW